MSLSITRNANDWKTTPGAVQGDVVSVNRYTGQVFQGTLTEFTNFLAYAVEAAGKIFNSAVPVGIAPTGSVAANGVITAGTAFAVTYPGIWLALPAAAAFTASPAGIYYCVFSSTTLGTIYNITLADGQAPYIPSAAALAAGEIVEVRGATAYTGITTITALATVTLPGKTLGKDGSLDISILGSHTNSAGAKTYTVKGGSATWLTAAATTTATANYSTSVTNRGSESVNISKGVNTVGVGANTTLITAVDTSADVAVTFNGTTAAATDWIVYELINVGVSPE